MNSHSRIFCGVFAPLVAFSVAFFTGDLSAAEPIKSPSSQGPLLVAELPPKPEIKKYELRYKVLRGDVLRYDVVDSRSIIGTSDQTSQSAKSRTDSIKAWKVTDVLPEGDIEFMNVVERVHMVNQVPDSKPTEYDSVRDKVAPPGYEDAAKRVGVPLSTVRMTPTGKIVHRESKARGQSTEEDSLIVLRLPEKPVSITDTWDEPFEIKVNLPKTGSKSIQTRWHYKLADVKDGIATIEVTYQVLSPIDAPIELQIIQRMMTGKVQFEIEKGRVLEQQMNVDKRVLGFAGPTSSVQYVMKMEEKLLKDEPKTASKPKSKTSARTPKSTRSTQTASRPKQPQNQSKTYRR
jgi:hypothetical protein